MTLMASGCNDMGERGGVARGLAGVTHIDFASLLYRICSLNPASCDRFIVKKSFSLFYTPCLCFFSSFSRFQQSPWNNCRIRHHSQFLGRCDFLLALQRRLLPHCNIFEMWFLKLILNDGWQRKPETEPCSMAVNVSSHRLKFSSVGLGVGE